MKKEIEGYIAPYDIGTIVKKGDKIIPIQHCTDKVSETKYISERRMKDTSPINIFNILLPVELVETWEPIYKDLTKEWNITGKENMLESTYKIIVSEKGIYHEGLNGYLSIKDLFQLLEGTGSIGVIKYEENSRCSNYESVTYKLRPDRNNTLYIEGYPIRIRYLAEILKYYYTSFQLVENKVLPEILNNY